jgi:hypothetical protein
MNLAKLIDLLKDRSINFARADQLGDPWEGCFTLVAREQYRDIARESPKNRGFLRAAQHAELVRPRTHFVSCWCLQEEESNLLWRVYAGGGNGVALRTTYRHLASSLPDNVFAGVVRYQNYKSGDFDDSNAYTAIMHKRIEYKDEREVRLVIDAITDKSLPVPYLDPVSGNMTPWDRFLAALPLGVKRRVALDFSACEVLVSPFSPTWFGEVVRHVVTCVCPSVPVRASESSPVPFHDDL